MFTSLLIQFSRCNQDDDTIETTAISGYMISDFDELTTISIGIMVDQKNLGSREHLSKQSVSASVNGVSFWLRF